MIRFWEMFFSAIGILAVAFLGGLALVLLTGCAPHPAPPCAQPGIYRNMLLKDAVQICP